MKVKVLRGFCLGKGKDVQPGDIIELSDKEAATKIKQGKVRDASLPEKERSTGKKSIKDVLELIAAAVTIAEIEDVTTGDNRAVVLQASAARIELLEKELEKESQGGGSDA